MKKFITVLMLLASLIASGYPTLTEMKAANKYVPDAAVKAVNPDTGEYYVLAVTSALDAMSVVSMALTTAAPVWTPGTKTDPGVMVLLDYASSTWRIAPCDASGRLIISSSGAFPVAGGLYVLPALTGESGQVLAFPAAGSTLEWVDMTGGSGGISIVGTTAEPIIAFDGSTYEATAVLPAVVSVAGLTGEIIQSANLKSALEALDAEAALAGVSIESLETFKALAGVSLELLETESALAGASLEAIEADYVKADSSPVFTGTVEALAFKGDGSGLTGLPSGVTDHGALTGLADNDHPQYSLLDSSPVFTGTVTASAFSGDGSALTNLPAGITGITVSVNSGATAETTALNFIEGDGINVEYASGNLTIEIGKTVTALTVENDFSAGGTLTVDESQNRVGVNNTAPSEALDVVGNIKASGTVATGGYVLPSAPAGAGGKVLKSVTGAAGETLAFADDSGANISTDGVLSTDVFIGNTGGFVYEFNNVSSSQDRYPQYDATYYLTAEQASFAPGALGTNGCLVELTAEVFTGAMNFDGDDKASYGVWFLGGAGADYNSGDSYYIAGIYQDSTPVMAIFVENNDLKCMFSNGVANTLQYGIDMGVPHYLVFVCHSSYTYPFLIDGKQTDAQISWSGRTYAHNRVIIGGDANKANRFQGVIDNFGYLSSGYNSPFAFAPYGGYQNKNTPHSLSGDAALTISYPATISASRLRRITPCAITDSDIKGVYSFDSGLVNSISNTACYFAKGTSGAPIYLPGVNRNGVRPNGNYIGPDLTALNAALADEEFTLIQFLRVNTGAATVIYPFTSNSTSNLSYYFSAAVAHSFSFGGQTVNLGTGYIPGNATYGYQWLVVGFAVKDTSCRFLFGKVVNFPGEAATVKQSESLVSVDSLSLYRGDLAFGSSPTYAPATTCYYRTLGVDVDEVILVDRQMTFGEMEAIVEGYIHNLGPSTELNHIITPTANGYESIPRQWLSPETDTPALTLEGMLWYDAANKKVKVWTGLTFEALH